jgi:cbb3-type cytochrome c oxidase subunit II
MIRPFRDEKERYGHYSLASESMFDHPFQWGSKRTGPDLARLGGKYSDEWQRQHLRAPALGGPGVRHAQLSLAGRCLRWTARRCSATCAA